MSYPFLIWWRPLRKPVLAAICAMHLGIALLMGMLLFGAIMIILNLAAFWPYEKSRLSPARATTGTAWLPAVK
jgi:hypothetical protein